MIKARIDECILYRDFQQGKSWRNGRSDQYLRTEPGSCFPKNGFFQVRQRVGGNGGTVWLFRKSLAQLPDFFLVNHENAFSTACEIKGTVEKEASTPLHCHDFSVFKELLCL